MRKIRFGIMGYAAIAKRALIPALLKANNASLHALASGKEESRRVAASLYPFEKMYDNYEDLLADPLVEAVYIPLPNALHKEWAIKAMRRGKHVLCEKPMALTKEDALDMAEESRKNGVLLMEAFMYRFHNKAKLIQKLLNEDLIGEVRFMSAAYSFVFDRDEDHRLVKEMGGGSFWDVGCYPVNLAGMVFQQMPVSVSAMKTEKRGVDFSLSALLQYQSGALCSVSGGFDAQSAQLTQINGTKGSLVFQDVFLGPPSPVKLYQNGVLMEYPVQDCDSYQNQVEDFAGAILEGREPAFKLEETIRNTELITRILNAAETHTGMGGT